MGWTIQKAKGFDPRIGATYQLDEKTVIRAGYGRSFDTGVFGSIFGHVVTQNLPVLANQELRAPSTTGYAFTFANGPHALTPSQQRSVQWSAAGARVCCEPEGTSESASFPDDRRMESGDSARHHSDDFTDRLPMLATRERTR